MKEPLTKKPLTLLSTISEEAPQFPEDKHVKSKIFGGVPQLP
jgi:hypothetical protein